MAKSILDLHDIWESLRGEAAERIARYVTYLDWYRGRHEAYMAIPAGRPVHKTNLCRRSVHMLANYILPDLFDIRALRRSEYETKFDTGTEVPNIEAEAQVAELQEKTLRKVFHRNGDQVKRRLQRGVESGLTLGDTVFHIRADEQMQPVVETTFPGHVRLSFKNDDFEVIQDGFIAQVMTVQAVYKKYGVHVAAMKAEQVDQLGLWDSSALLNEDSTLVITHYDEMYKSVFALSAPGSYLEEPKPHLKYGIPLVHIPALENPFSPYGSSYLEDIIPINKEHNEAISDEAAIAKIFSRPKVVITGATQKEVDAMKAMWESGVIASRNNLVVTPFQFTGQMFPIEQRIQKIEDRFFRQSGLGPATFGQPPGSINTGASLTVQFAPTLQMAQIVWKQWEPKMHLLLKHIIAILKQAGTDPDSGKTYSEIFKGEPRFVLKTPFQMPRDESIAIANEMQKYQMGQSRIRTLQNLGIQSPQDELTVRTYEDIVLAQMLPERVQQSGNGQTSPQMGAMQGGMAREMQAAAPQASNIIRPA